MKTRNAVASLLTLVSMGLSDVGAVELKDSTSVTPDTLKVCVSDNPVLGPGIYLDLPDSRYTGKRLGNHFDPPFLVSDNSIVGWHIQTKSVEGSIILVTQLFGPGIFVGNPHFASTPLFEHLDSLMTTRFVGYDKTDLQKYLDGYVGNMNH
ncbi:hypothetical protein HYT57_02390 [Candidatus Woesearchaeota archaeon]|nr:hypothetical protein [Candidatus Woesearchaeota archaeon]